MRALSFMDPVSAPGPHSSMPTGHPEGFLVLKPAELAALTFVLTRKQGESTQRLPQVATGPARQADPQGPMKQKAGWDLSAQQEPRPLVHPQQSTLGTASPTIQRAACPSAP